MGHSQAEKAATRERILTIASERFREAGVDGLSLADLMAAAGLTHGGFYKHFRSREDLVAQAVARALEEGRDRSKGVSSRMALIDAYLTTVHRDDVGHGCAMAGLAADVARCAPDARAPYTAAVARNIAAMARLEDDPDPAIARSRAIATLSAMVGALNLARAVDDPALSAEILNAVAMVLKVGTD